MVPLRAEVDRSSGRLRLDGCGNEESWNEENGAGDAHDQPVPDIELLSSVMTLFGGASPVWVTRAVCYLLAKSEEAAV
jgi:hypothetical protein